jgi:DNA-binding Lrp family transcriptional regulator
MAKSVGLDDLDRQLIALLRDSARLSVVTLAKQLRVARATTQNRTSRLETNGGIVGHTVRLNDPASLRKPLHRIVSEQEATELC